MTSAQRRTRMSALQSPVPTTVEKCEMRTKHCAASGDSRGTACLGTREAGSVDQKITTCLNASISSRLNDFGFGAVMLPSGYPPAVHQPQTGSHPVKLPPARRILPFHLSGWNRRRTCSGCEKRHSPFQGSAPHSKCKYGGSFYRNLNHNN